MPRHQAGSTRLWLGAACGLSFLVGAGLLSVAFRGAPGVIAAPARSFDEAPSAGADARAAARGKRIYRSGLGRPGATIRATLGGSGTEIDAALVTCAGCHGDDGRGRPEGGLEPPDLSWDVLTRPDGARDRLGRLRPPYDVALLARAVAMGIGAGGRELDPGMPRYQLTRDDMADLVAYLTVLGRDETPGVSDDEIRLGSLLPPASRSGGVGSAIRETLSARVAQLNREGGVYRRRLAVEFLELPGSPAEAGEAVAAFLESARPFALVACDLSGFEGAVGRVLREREVPAVGAFTSDPDEGLPLNPWVFYVQSGLKDQCAALARFAAAYVPGLKAGVGPALVSEDGPGLARAAEGVSRAWEAETGRSLLRIKVGPGDDAAVVAAGLRARGCEAVFVLTSSGFLHEFTTAAASKGWHPYLLAPSALSGPEMFETPRGFDRRVFLAFPHLVSDQTVSGSARLRRLEDEASLGRDHLAVRLATLASVEVLVEGLTRSGRRLDRDGLVRRLETLRRFESGFVPPLSYSPGERVGARGAHVLTVDLEGKRLRPLGVWVPAPGAP